MPGNCEFVKHQAISRTPTFCVIIASSDYQSIDLVSACEKYQPNNAKPYLLQ